MAPIVFPPGAGRAVKRLTFSDKLAAMSLDDPAVATAERSPSPATVRDATLDVLRELGLTTMFSNPGSTEIPFLAGLPDDLRFVLALHEGSVVGMATGWALSRGEPALVLLHTTAGLGNAVSALATARVNRAPLVVLVGQQDRRHLALQPFLAGRLEGLAGDYPVWIDQPARPQDVPGAIVRAYHEAITHRGPALVIVPMSDWEAPAPEPHEIPGPQRLVHAVAADAGAVAELAAFVDAAQAPALVVGAGADDARSWAALVRLAERLAVPVWQEAFGARAGFPQDHPQFAGWLPARRTELREVLAPHDAILVVGAPAFRQYAYDTGPMIEPGTRVALVTDDPDEAHRSPSVLTVLGDPGATIEALAESVAERPGPAPQLDATLPAPAPPAPGEPMRAAHVLAALGARVSRDTIVVEESPSSRRELNARLPGREPMTVLTAAMGGLGFALPGATGLRMGNPRRPVVAIVGDGSAMYQIQALWSAARYRAGVLFVILNNGGYAIMDWLVAQTGQDGPWPALEEVQITTLARGLGCEAERIDDHATLLARLDEVVPTLAGRETPLVLEVVVAPDEAIVP
jgi:thiamine pyrophosphate-dependent acetolactate synthase large subunit-like protein